MAAAGPPTPLTTFIAELTVPAPIAPATPCSRRDRRPDASTSAVATISDPATIDRTSLSARCASDATTGATTSAGSNNRSASPGTAVRRSTVSNPTLTTSASRLTRRTPLVGVVTITNTGAATSENPNPVTDCASAPHATAVATSAIAPPLSSTTCKSIAGRDVDETEERLTGLVAAKVRDEHVQQRVERGRHAPRDVRAEPHLGMRVHPMALGERLGLHRVERRPRDRPVVERGPQRVLVHERATGDVDQMHARLHRPEGRRVEEMAGLGRRRRGHDHVVRTLEHLGERSDELDARVRRRRVGTAQRAHGHAERQRALGDRAPDASEADERQRLAAQPAERSPGREVPVLRLRGDPRVG